MRRAEAARRFVEAAQELAGGGQRGVAPPRIGPAAEHEIAEGILGNAEDVALDELEHVAAVLVEAERAGRAGEAGAHADARAARAPPASTARPGGEPYSPTRTTPAAERPPVSGISGSSDELGLAAEHAHLAEEVRGAGRTL